MQLGLVAPQPDLIAMAMSEEIVSSEHPAAYYEPNGDEGVV